MPPPIVRVPVVVKFLKPDASKFPSTTTALFASTVPLVMPSNFSRSVSLISALPIIKEPPEVILPVDVTAPELTVPPTIRFSPTLIVVESDESSVVPFTLIAPINTSPVPLA